VDQLAQAYHWSLDQILELTMPQILMLNHAAWVSAERRRPLKEGEFTHEPTIRGKKLEEATTDEWVDYYKDM
jgi:hypothetical protein